MVLRALGYNLTTERQAWYIWDLVRHQLRARKILFLHLDEAQDLSSRGTAKELNAVASMLKTLMTDEQWPVGILLSGTEELEVILNHDPQLARRLDTVHFGPLSAVHHAPEVIALVDGYAQRAGISADASVSLLAFAERLIHSAAFQFGLVIEITIAAIEVALLEETDTLTQTHSTRSPCRTISRSTHAKSSPGRCNDVFTFHPAAALRRALSRGNGDFGCFPLGASEWCAATDCFLL